MAKDCVIKYIMCWSLVGGLSVLFSVLFLRKLPMDLMKMLITEGMPRFHREL